MNRKNATKKSLLISLLALCLCCAMFIGTTFAWFTDSVTSANNIIQSGNLDVEMYWADGTQAVPAADSAEWIDASTGAIFDYSNWEPGYVQVRHIRIANNGSLALKYAISIAATGEVTDLSDVIDVYYVDPAVQVADRADLSETYKLCTLTEALANLGNSGTGSLEAGAAHTITIALKMRESAGNDYMNKAIGSSFCIQLVATQMTSESDSFGNDYDAEATYPAITSGVVGGNEKLRAGEVTVVLPSGAAKDLYTLKVDNKQVQTNAAYETVLSLDIELLKNGVKVEAQPGTSYTVTIDIPAGVVISGVSHNGAAVENYTYNPSNGQVTFATDSFSPFAVAYFDNVIKINSAEEFIAALTEIKTEAKLQIPGAEGNKAYRENAIFVLENDIVIDGNTEFMYTDSNGGVLHFYGVKGVVDLNGHNIVVQSDALLSGKSHANAVFLVQYSNIDIIGQGSIIANNKSVPVYAWANGSVNIYGGNYVTNASERNESAVYVNNASITVNVYGGTFTDTAYAFNVHDNCGSTPVITLHEGITYADFFKGTIDLVAQDVAKGRIVVAEGCEIVEYEEDGVAMNKIEKK